MPDDQPMASPTYYSPAPAGVFRTKIPSSVCFAIGLLLFLLPFAELQCKPPDQKNNALLDMVNIKISASNTGLGLAAGSDWKFNISQGSGLFQEKKEETWIKNIKAQDPNIYAIVALSLAVLGFGLSFLNARPVFALNIATGVLTAGSLTGLMIDLTKKSKDFISDIKKTGNSVEVGEYTDITLTFTPWFYVSLVAFLAAAFFSYKRRQIIKK